MENSAQPFDPVQFEATWEKLSEEEKADMLKTVPDLDPAQAILPVLAGISSYHFNVRNEARKGLERIQSDLQSLLSRPWEKAEFQKGLKLSESICTRIYSQVNSKLPLSETSFFFKKLIQFDGQGPYFAFKIVYNGFISASVAGKLLEPESESLKLAFVDQYLQSSPDIRLKFGRPFKHILRSISQREAVVRFYSGLFDNRKDADPFLNNIDPELRNPDDIIENEIKSASPGIKISGLKALSMIINEIDPDLLLDILATEEVKKVRIAIYAIIENSTMGTYSRLFYPLLELFYRCGKQEALCAFKALVVTGKLPVHALLDLVRENYPSLLPDINMEISSLSKISFFIIQDIALNKNKYAHANFEINLACVLGMIRKRPERVVKILKKYDNDSQDSIRMNVTRFIEKTKDMISRERKQIEAEFKPVIEQVKSASKQTKGLLDNFFTSTTDKKIALVKTRGYRSSVDFHGELIKDIDFSGLNSHAASIFFNRAIVNNCDFSHASFTHVFFKKAVFYNVNMENIHFYDGCFDDAVFINVNARAAVFENCSFQNVSMFNCNFNEAVIKDASFLNAKISRTSFNSADLFGSSLCFSKISAVSFVTTHLDHADFSYTRMRFCRLPSDSVAKIRKVKIDYNARKYQLSFKDVPRIDAAIVKDIDILTFSEFIHYGENKFLRQNRLSLLTAFDIFKSRQADLFVLVPLLLHTNIKFPGLETTDETAPAGIFGYTPSRETIDTLKSYVRIEDETCLQNKTPYIEGLFTIGSVGSVAQTSDSDIDYWVCINENNYNQTDIDRLDRKLANLERMALTQFEIQVTFFRVDILKAKNNDFGDSTIESSGSAQARILKEEFYRTMIHVAGKIPLWAVLPTAISVHYYNTILEHTGSLPHLSRYIDLGDIHAISTSEYFGASIWQMFKWLKSPFKSVIKMALLEKYIYEYGKESLLCNKYKDEWMNSGAYLKLAQNDSYYILLKNLLLYFEQAMDSESVELILTCFFLKLEISKEAEIDGTVFGLRKILLDKCMRKWGWDKEKILEIGSFKSWRYSQIVSLSMTIEKYMVKKYKTVSKSFETLLKGRSSISPEDRTVLGRKVFIEFSNQPDKVRKVLLVSRSDRHFQGLHLRYLNPTNTVGSWELLNRDSKAVEKHEERLIQAKTIEEIGAWLINNSLYNSEAVINLVPNPTYVTFDDIRKLYRAMNDFFAPQLKQVISFDQLLLKDRIASLFISVNFYAPRLQHRVTEYTAVYLNSWGEMFCKSVYSKKGFPHLEAAKKDIVKRLEIERLPEETAFYFSKGYAR